LRFGSIAGIGSGDNREMVVSEGDGVGNDPDGGVCGGRGGRRFGGGGRSRGEGSMDLVESDPVDGLRRFSPTRFMTDLSS